MKSITTKILSILVLSLAVASAQAAPVYWSDWTSTNNGNTVQGQIDINGDLIDVTVTMNSPFQFVQTDATGGTNYWSTGRSVNDYSSVYTSANVDNGPMTNDIIALNTGGTVSISFSQQVSNVYFGLVSWNNGANTISFTDPVAIENVGQGHWGSGSASIAANGDVIATGELHGLISASGNFNQIGFTHGTENWHGFSISVGGLADNMTEASAPAALGLLLFSFICIVLRRKL